MHLKINDFKKVGWNCSKFTAVKTIYDEENNLKYIKSATFDESGGIDTFSINITDSVVNYIEIQIDDISTIEELEKTAKDLYLAIKGLE